jgi:hypothetical protein
VDNQVDGRIAAVRGALPELDTDPAVNCYWVTGSLTAGLGTRTSDLDITVITESAANKRFCGIRAGVRDVNSQRADIDVHSIEWLRELPDLVCNYTASTTDHRQLFTAEPILKAVAQMHAGVRIVKDSAEFADVRAALQAGETDFRRLLVARAAMYANNTQEDVVGFIADGDFESALLRARDLLMFGLDAWAVARGEPYPGTKWIWRRLGRIITSPAALSLVRSMLFDPVPNAMSRVHQINALNQTLLAQALLVCWSRDLSAAVEPAVPDMRARGIWRAPGWTPNRMADEWYLTDRRSTYRMPFTAVICWAFANGLAIDDLAGRVIKQSMEWFGVPISQRTASSVAGRLTELGALAEGSLDTVADAFYAAEAG